MSDVVGKNPAFQFYPSDWSNDTCMLSLEIKGAWIDLICAMWWNGDKGEITGSHEDFARLLRTSIDYTKSIIDTLKCKKICNIEVRPDGNITIINRRMKREEEHRKYNADKAKRHYDKKKKEPLKESLTESLPKSDPHSSSSSSSSILSKEKISKADSEKKTENHDYYSDQIDMLKEKLYKVYWKKVHAWVNTMAKKKIKAKAIYFCLLRIDEERPKDIDPWAYCEGILKTYNDSEIHKKDNVFLDIANKLKILST